MLKTLTDRLREGLELAAPQAQAALQHLTAEQEPAEAKADFLAALAQKGETVAEIAAFARGLRELSTPVPLEAEMRARGILDVVGTGGDRLQTFNISTAAALVASAAGLTVAKHGNRAVTSKSGSADVLEALGIPIDLSPDEAAVWLREHRFAFLFAPRYHPAFKHIAPARKLCAARGQRTIFNLLGPLLNPARPDSILLGTPRPELCEPMAGVLRELGVRRGLVVCGQAGPEAWLDELSILGSNRVSECSPEEGLVSYLLDPEPFRTQPATLADLQGADAAANAEMARRLLRGEDRTPRRDMVLLNTAGAFLAAGRVGSLAEGRELAAATLDEGKAFDKLQELVEAGGRRGK